MNLCLDTYGGLVWSLVTRRCRNRSDAEEVVQEVFLDVWRSAERFDPAVAKESTFIAMIARRRLIDRARKLSRSVSVSSLDADASKSTEPAMDGRGADENWRVELADEVDGIRRKMSDLRPEEKSVLEMAIDGGMSHAQIAAKTSMPLGTVKTHARRGLIRLREMLAGEATIEGGTR